MQLPLQITFRHLESSAALKNNIRKHAAELDQFYDQIMSYRAMVDAGHKPVVSKSPANITSWGRNII